MNEGLIELFKDLALYEDYMTKQDPKRKWAALSYKKGIDILKSLDYEITLKNVDKLSNIRGIGSAIRDKSKAWLRRQSGDTATKAEDDETLKRYDAFLKSPAVGARELVDVKNLGVLNAIALAEAGIMTKAQLQEKVKDLNPGDYIVPGVKLTAAIKNSVLNDLHSATNRMKIDEHNGIADQIIDSLKKVYGVVKISAAGSARRFDGSSDYTIGDIDIIIGTDGTNDEFIRGQAEDLLDKITKSGQAKISGVKSGRQVDISIVPVADYSSLLLHATGSAEFNKECRRLAIKNGWKLNEYGLFDANGVCLSKDEAEILDMLGLGWVEPKDRIRGYKANI